MLPHEVEAHRLRGLDVRAQGVVARRGVDAVRPVALVEHAAQEARLVVDDDLGVAPVDRPPPGVGLDEVAGLRLDLDRVEDRRLGAPAAVEPLRRADVHDGRLARLHADGENAVGIDAGVDAADVRVGDGLEAHGLPDPGGPRVPDAAARPLLAARLRALGGILDVDHELVLCGGIEATEVEAEARVAAGVGAGVAAVDVHRRAPVDGPEAQQHP